MQGSQPLVPAIRLAGGPLGGWRIFLRREVSSGCGAAIRTALCPKGRHRTNWTRNGAAAPFPSRLPGLFLR